MVRVDMRQVINAAQQLHAQGRHMVNQLNRVKVTMGQVPHSEGFQGAAQRSMGIYVRQVHDNAAETLAGNVTDLSREFEQLITMFRSGVDSRDDAILDTDYLQEQRQKLESLYRELDQGIHKGNEGCTQASGLATVIRLRTTALTELEDSERSIMQTQQRLAEFNGIRTPQRINNLSDSAAKVASHIKVSLDHKGDNVFMGGLGQTTKAKVKHGKKNQRVTVRSVNHRAVQHEEDSNIFKDIILEELLNGVSKAGKYGNIYSKGLSFITSLLLNNNGAKAPSRHVLEKTTAQFVAGEVATDGMNVAATDAGLTVAGAGITASLPAIVVSGSILLIGIGVTNEVGYMMDHPHAFKKSGEEDNEIKRRGAGKYGVAYGGKLPKKTVKVDQPKDYKESTSAAYAAAFAGQVKK
ncbi:T7SS effector LXG polymorphic toxin [Furfurilactobacillus entadae]|uniref:T7SS effector LXG polymorphic toxin n=1 Tax=Furfurilactobacillus entadae TaxID=2922307 RepID=UPI0035EA9F8A